MKLRIITVAVAAGALALAAAAPASAIPVRNLKVFGQGSNSILVGAQVFSPPTSDGCGASYRIAILDPQQLVRNRIGRINVCRGDANNGWSFGVVLQRFNVSDLPVGTYTVCVIASQSINGGYTSRHGICRKRRI